MNPLARAIDHLLCHALPRPPAITSTGLSTRTNEATAFTGGVLAAHAGQHVLARAQPHEQRERRQPHAQPEVRRHLREGRVVVAVVVPPVAAVRGVRCGAPRRRLEVLEPGVVVRQHEHCVRELAIVSALPECVLPRAA